MARRSEHSEQRRSEWRRTGPAFNDAQRATRSNVAWDTYTDRFVVQGEEGRYQIFEANGEHVTQVDYDRQTWLERHRIERWKELTDEQWDLFQKLFQSQ